MSAVRRPRVLPTPSLADLVTDLDSQIPEGDGPVELPAETWGQLADQASRELARHVERNVNELEDLRKFREDVRELVGMSSTAHESAILGELENLRAVFLESQSAAMLKAGGPGPSELFEYKRRLAVALGEQPDNPDSVDLIVLARSTREVADRWEASVRPKKADAVKAFERQGEVEGRWPAPDPGPEFQPIPPPKKRPRKQRRISCEHCGDTDHVSDDCGLKPDRELEEAAATATPPAQQEVPF